MPRKKKKSRRYGRALSKATDVTLSDAADADRPLTGRASKARTAKTIELTSLHIFNTEKEA